MQNLLLKLQQCLLVWPNKVDTSPVNYAADCKLCEEDLKDESLEALKVS